MFPETFFYVGIAEARGRVCGGLAAGGLRPVYAVYATFMQRALTACFTMSACRTCR